MGLFYKISLGFCKNKYDNEVIDLRRLTPEEITRIINQ